MKILTEQDFRNHDQMIRKNIAQAVYDKRKANGWTRYELSKRCGVNYHSIKRIESGGEFDTRMLLRVLKCLDIEMMIL